MQQMIYAILSPKSSQPALDTLITQIKGIAGTELQTISHGEISAIVGEISKADLVASRSDVLQYAGVIEALAELGPVLPVRFGSLMESTDSVRNMLQRNSIEIQQNLLKVENKSEFGLKILCDPEELKAQLKARSETTSGTPVVTSIERKSSVYMDYVNKKLSEHRVEEMLLVHIDSVITEISRLLTRLEAITKFTKMASPTTLVDALFLIEKKKKEELIRVVEEVQKKYPSLRFVMTGPWPPYNFVDFKVK